jgi:hypothetical protein
METQEVTLTGGCLGGVTTSITEVDSWGIGGFKAFPHTDDEGVQRNCFYRRDAETYAVFIEEIILS